MTKSVNHYKNILIDNINRDVAEHKKKTKYVDIIVYERLIYSAIKCGLEEYRKVGKNHKEEARHIMDEINKIGFHTQIYSDPDVLLEPRKKSIESVISKLLQVICSEKFNKNGDFANCCRAIIKQTKEEPLSNGTGNFDFSKLTSTLEQKAPFYSSMFSTPVASPTPKTTEKTTSYDLDTNNDLR